MVWGPKGWGAWYGAQMLSSSASGKITTFVILPDNGFLWSACGFSLEGSSLLFLPILMLSFHLLLWRFCLPTFRVPFRRNYFIHSCRFVVSIGGGKFRIFLCHHLQPFLPYFNFCSILSTIKYFFNLYISFWISLAYSKVCNGHYRHYSNTLLYKYKIKLSKAMSRIIQKLLRKHIKRRKHIGSELIHFIRI